MRFIINQPLQPLGITVVHPAWRPGQGCAYGGLRFLEFRCHGDLADIVDSSYHPVHEEKKGKGIFISEHYIIECISTELL